LIKFSVEVQPSRPGIWAVFAASFVLACQEEMPWSPSLRPVLPHRPDPKPADPSFLKAFAPSGTLRLVP